MPSTPPWRPRNAAGGALERDRHGEDPGVLSSHDASIPDRPSAYVRRPPAVTWRPDASTAGTVAWPAATTRSRWRLESSPISGSRLVRRGPGGGPRRHGAADRPTPLPPGKGVIRLCAPQRGWRRHLSRSKKSRASRSGHCRRQRRYPMSGWRAIVAARSAGHTWIPLSKGL